MKKYIFIRNDDIYRYSKKFLDVFMFFKKHKIPVIYGVVPKLIEKKLVDFLNKEKKLNPHLLDIVQHGWSHKNHSEDINNKYEFGPSRSYFQQKQDIKKGYLKMKKLFNENFTPAFIPPYHRYDLNTIKIINELNFPIFSGGKKVLFNNKKFLDLPAYINLNNFLDLQAIIRNFIRIRKKTSVIGMVFHYNKLNLKNFKILSDFLLLLKKLKDKKEIDFLLFSKILKIYEKKNFILLHS